MRNKLEPLCKYECVLCGSKIKEFLPYMIQDSEYIKKFKIIGSDVKNFACPYCSCNDRERHLVMFFSKLNIWKKSITDKTVLHIAPEYHIRNIISQMKPKEYVCGDLFPDDSKNIVKIDITNIKYSDNYFDFIICNHVLEHIINDITAMKELYRVLKPGGRAVLQTPYSREIKKSSEDSSITSERERLKHFGQEDHVRIYGLDLFERLKTAGFKLNIVRNGDLFSLEECKHYGVNCREDLIMVEK